MLLKHAQLLGGSIRQRYNSILGFLWLNFKLPKRHRSFCDTTVSICWLCFAFENTIAFYTIFATFTILMFAVATASMSNLSSCACTPWSKDKPAHSFFFCLSFIPSSYLCYPMPSKCNSNVIAVSINKQLLQDDRSLSWMGTVLNLNELCLTYVTSVNEFSTNSIQIQQKNPHWQGANIYFVSCMS